VRIRFIGHDQRWERDLAFDPTDDSRELLRLLSGLLDGGNSRRVLPGPMNATPLSVSVTLLRLVPRTQSSGSLFAPAGGTRRVDTVVDRINAKFGYNKLYFGSMQLALEHDAAPMRIPFYRVPDAQSENEATRENDASHDPLWLQTMNRFKAIAEGEHRRREQKSRKG
jgi:DNA polymerase-4